MRFDLILVINKVVVYNVINLVLHYLMALIKNQCVNISIVVNYSTLKLHSNNIVVYFNKMNILYIVFDY